MIHLTKSVMPITNEVVFKKENKNNVICSVMC